MLDHYTKERLALDHIAEHQRFADNRRVLDRIEEEPQATLSVGRRWFSRLLRSLGTERTPDLYTLDRL